MRQEEVMWKHRSNRDQGHRKGPGTRHFPWAGDGVKGKTAAMDEEHLSLQGTRWRMKKG